MPQQKNPEQRGTWRSNIIGQSPAHLVVDGYGFGNEFYETGCGSAQAYVTTKRDEDPENRCHTCLINEPIYRTAWEEDRW